MVLDVFDGWFLPGVLMRPRDIGADGGGVRWWCASTASRDGRPTPCARRAGWDACKGFTRRLADRGFATFAPQPVYIGRDRFRLLAPVQAQPVGEDAFLAHGVAAPAAGVGRRLGSPDFVDADRIGFHGRLRRRQVGHEDSSRGPRIPGRDLFRRFQRLDLEERLETKPPGGAAPDERVAYEFAKARHLCQARPGIGDRAEIEWFVGPPTISGDGTFRILHRHPQWSEPSAR